MTSDVRPTTFGPLSSRSWAQRLLGELSISTIKGSLPVLVPRGRAGQQFLHLGASPQSAFWMGGRCVAPGLKPWWSASPCFPPWTTSNLPSRPAQCSTLLLPGSSSDYGNFIQVKPKLPQVHLKLSLASHNLQEQKPPAPGFLSTLTGPQY